MVEGQFLKTRVSPDTKRRVQSAAERQLLTESVWLRRIIDAALAAESGGTQTDELTGAIRGHSSAGRHSSDWRLYVRLRQEDRLLLCERAAARGMAGAATYASVVIRAHLRKLAPLPRDELVALKQSVAELGAIGRNLNQIARAANQGSRLAGPGRDDLRAILKVCEALRDNVKALIKASVNSWEIGYEEAKS